MGNKWIGITVAGIVLTTAAVGGYTLANKNLKTTMVSTIPVSVFSATNGSLSKGQMFSGITDTAQKVPLAPTLSSKITKVYVKVGDKVKKGQPLFAVDPAPMEQTINQAKAGVDAAKANLAQALKQQEAMNQQNQQQSQAQLIVEYEAKVKERSDAIARKDAIKEELKQANDLLNKAQDKFDSARNDYEFIKSLHTNGQVSQELVEQASQEMNQAEGALHAARNEYNRLKNEQSQLVIPPEPVKPGQPNVQPTTHPAVEAAKQQVAQAENIYNKVVASVNPVITAPISGTVEAINGGVGKVASNRQVFMVLGNVQGLKVILNVPESVKNQFQNNQKVNILIPSTDKRLNGNIQTIHPVDPKTKSCIIELTLSDSKGLKAGQVAQINLLPNHVKQGILIPVTSLLTENQKKYVYIASGDKAIKKYVQVIEQDTEHAIITGVNEGDQVIYKGLSLVNEDVKISIK